MKKKFLVMGIMMALFMVMIILSGCTNIDGSNTNDNTISTEEIEDAQEVVMKDYTYKELSFKLPDSFEISDKSSEESTMYTTDLIDSEMKMFAISSLSAQGVNFIEQAEASLDDYPFEISNYELVEKGNVERKTLDGIDAISCTVKYKGKIIDGFAAVEYIYLQKDDTVYVVCCELFTEKGKEVNAADLSYFDDIKGSFKFN